MTLAQTEIKTAKKMPNRDQDAFSLNFNNLDDINIDMETEHG
jgi:hypothetical protein